MRDPCVNSSCLFSLPSLPPWSPLLAFNERLILRGVFLVSWREALGVGGRERDIPINNRPPSALSS